MTIKVFISGICGSQEVRKQQQRVLFILQSLPIDLQIIDVTEPGRDDDLNFMQEEVKKHNKSTQLPPQIFNGDEYCGDYADFEMANDDDVIMRFLKLEESPVAAAGDVITQNGIDSHGNEDNKDSEEILVEQNSHETISETINSTDEQNESNIEQVTNEDEIKIETSVPDDSVISENVESSEKVSEDVNEIIVKESSEEGSEEESE